MSKASHSDCETEDQEMLEAIAAAFGQDALDDFRDSQATAATESTRSAEATPVAVEDTPWLAPASPSAEQHAENQTAAIQAPDIEATSNEAHSRQANARQATTRSAIDGTTERFVLLDIGASCFGFPMKNVYEIQRVPSITPLPGVPEWVLGVTNLRGNVVSVVDIKTILGIPSSDKMLAQSRRGVMIYSHLDDIETTVIVDRVHGIHALDCTGITPPTDAHDDRVKPFLSGTFDVEDRSVSLLDLEKLLISKAFRQFDAA